MRVANGFRKLTLNGVRVVSKEFCKALIAAALCVLMVDQPMYASNTSRRGPTAGTQQSKGEGRVLHALNRLTFGPRPGDVAAVEAMGLSSWFEMQLNPEKIDDSALQGRLAEFPAMQLPQQELLAKYPSAQIIRQMTLRQQAAEKLLQQRAARPFSRRREFGPQASTTVPSDPVERAIYADEMEFYRAQQANKAAKDAATVSNASASDTMQSAVATESSQPAAPIERREPGSAPSATGTNADATMAGAGMNTGATAALTKDGIADPSQAAPQHVEKLFKDLETVKILNLAPNERMRKVIAMAPTDFVAFRQSLSGVELGQFMQGLSPQQREIFQAMQNSTRMVAIEEMQERLIRDIYSQRQLEAVMTDFWLNHFNVYARKNQNEPFLIPAYVRESIRPHALGKFEDLLVATAESPAMLMYLDNWQSIGPDSAAAKNAPRAGRFVQNQQAKAALKDRGLNENYGRELMELHTLGVNGGYTQKDVTEVAKVFTGWTITPMTQGGMFQFDERKHEPGPKTVLGKTIQENGMNEGLQVLHMLATSPSTAKFISTKLAVRFVSDNPPPALVDRMSKTFLGTGGDIKAVLRTMFESPEFWDPAAVRSKVKTPEEFVISAVRASDATVNNAQGLVVALDRLGMPLYGMQTPNGYSWMNESWVSTGALVSRMNFALVLAGDRLPGVRTDWLQVLRSPAVSDAEVNGSQVATKERKLEAALVGFPLSEKTRTAVEAQADDRNVAVQAAKDLQLGGAGGLFGAVPRPGVSIAALGLPETNAGNARRNGPDDGQAAVMAGLLLGSPEFQRR